MTNWNPITQTRQLSDQAVAEIIEELKQVRDNYLKCVDLYTDALEQAGTARKERDVCIHALELVRESVHDYCCPQFDHRHSEECAALNAALVPANRRKAQF